jgi:hypothetical protein
VKSRPWPCRLSLRRRSDRLCGAHAVTLLIVWRCKWTSDPVIAFEYSHRVSELARPTVAHMEEGIDNGCGLLLFPYDGYHKKVCHLSQLWVGNRRRPWNRYRSQKR